MLQIITLAYASFHLLLQKTFMSEVCFTGICLFPCLCTPRLPLVVSYSPLVPMRLKHIVSTVIWPQLSHLPLIYGKHRIYYSYLLYYITMSDNMWGFKNLFDLVYYRKRAFTSLFSYFEYNATDKNQRIVSVDWRVGIERCISVGLKQLIAHTIVPTTTIKDCALLCK